MKTIDLPPYAPTLIESTRAIGYTLEAALADLIDNSIAAGASQIDINYFPSEDPYIQIIDDGTGMNSDELTNAMQYGSKNPQDLRSEKDLGRFGLGLKTASLSQCRSLTVLSKNQGNLEARRWDLDHVIEKGTWSLIQLEGNEIDELPGIAEFKKKKQGTYILWKNLDRLLAGETDREELLSSKMDKVRSHLSLVFHRYLEGETGLSKIKILMNGLQLTPVDPFLIGKSQKIIDEEVFDIRGEEVTITPYLLPHPSKLKVKELEALGGTEGMRKNQGFYIYRNKRLLVWGTWFRLKRQKEEYKLTRIKVDIPNSLDDLWSLDIKKSTAYPPDLIKKNLRSIIESMAETSKTTYTFRGRKETDRKVKHIWEKNKTRDGSIFYTINMDYPVISAVLEKYPELKKDLSLILRQVENEIPVNSIYTDLINDEKIKNDSSQTFKDILADFNQTLEYVEPAFRKQMAEMLLKSAPFNQYKNQLKKEMEKRK